MCPDRDSNGKASVCVRVRVCVCVMGAQLGLKHHEGVETHLCVCSMSERQKKKGSRNQKNAVAL